MISQHQETFVVEFFEHIVRERSLHDKLEG